MAGKQLQTNTVESRKSVVDDKLKADAEVHILVGGPYKLDGEEHRYGHTAIRVVRRGSDVTYDFGRYGRTTGDFGAEGEGILRVWSNFSKYISGENALGRLTTEYIYPVIESQAKAVEAFFDGVEKQGKPRPDLQRGRPELTVFQLSTNYHALKYNCTTLSLDGMRTALPGFENGSSAFIAPEDVLTWGERAAMKTVGGGTPNRVFLPANLKKFLDQKPAVKPANVINHGSQGK
jgi:hypothetical protein